MLAYLVLATWVARSGEEGEVEAVLRRMIEPSRAESGCRLYLPHRSNDDPRTFVLVEQYDDEAAYAAHTESEHFRAYALGEGIPRLERRERIFAQSLD